MNQPNQPDNAALRTLQNHEDFGFSTITGKFCKRML